MWTLRATGSRLSSKYGALTWLIARAEILHSPAALHRLNRVDTSAPQVLYIGNGTTISYARIALLFFFLTIFELLLLVYLSGDLLLVQLALFKCHTALKCATSFHAVGVLQLVIKDESYRTIVYEKYRCGGLAHG